MPWRVCSATAPHGLGYLRDLHPQEQIPFVVNAFQSWLFSTSEEVREPGTLAARQGPVLAIFIQIKFSWHRADALLCLGYFQLGYLALCCSCEVRQF